MCSCEGRELQIAAHLGIKLSQPPTRHSAKKSSCQAAVCTRRHFAISCRPSYTCTRRYCRQSATACFCAPRCYDDHGPTSSIRLRIHTLCVIYPLFMCTSYFNVQHYIEKTPPRSPPPTNGIRWKSEQRFQSAHILCRPAAPLDQNKLQTPMRKPSTRGSLHSIHNMWLYLWSKT
jgi:hypothetical protein